jgi:hypothetical protein
MIWKLYLPDPMKIHCEGNVLKDSRPRQSAQEKSRKQPDHDIMLRSILHTHRESRYFTQETYTLVFGKDFFSRKLIDSPVKLDSAAYVDFSKDIITIFLNGPPHIQWEKYKNPHGHTKFEELAQRIAIPCRLENENVIFNLANFQQLKHISLFISLFREPAWRPLPRFPPGPSPSDIKLQEDEARVEKELLDAVRNANRPIPTLEYLTLLEWVDEYDEKEITE